MHVRRIKPVFAIGNAPLIPSLATVSGYDVVHIQHPFIFGAELTLLARLRSRRTALVATYQNRLMGDGIRRPLFWVYEETVGRALARSADRNCILSAAHADSVSYLRSGRRARPERFVEVPNGVDTQAFTPGTAPEVRERHGVPLDAKVALFAAALDRAHHFKRFDLALQGLMRTERSDIHMLVVGGGELLETFREQTESAGMTQRVHFAGAQKHADLPTHMRAADLLILPSDPPESFGIVLAEAMACGLPAIVSDIPGPSQTVVDGVTGYVFRRGDAGDLATKLVQAADLPPAERRAMGGAGRERCEELYSWNRVVDRLEAVYADAIEQRRRRRSFRPLRRA